MKAFVALVALVAAGLAVACVPLKPPPGPPQPLVIKTDGTVVDGGTYQEISIDGAQDVTVRNVTIDNAGFTGDPTQVGADCFYVKDSGNVKFENSTCLNAHREGVAVISTRPGAGVWVANITFTGVSRQIFDLEPNTLSQHIGSFLITGTNATTDGKGWGVVHIACCDSVHAYSNTYVGRDMREGSFGPGRYLPRKKHRHG